MALRLISNQTPRSKKKEYDSERQRVTKAYADICKQEHAADQQQVREYVQKYMAFPATAEDIYAKILDALPENVMCKTRDRGGITSTVSNLLRLRSDVDLKGGGKDGGTYVLRASVAPKPPVTKPQLVKAVPVTQNTSGFATKSDFNELKEQISSLRDVVMSLK